MEAVIQQLAAGNESLPVSTSVETQLKWIFDNSINARHSITQRTVLHELVARYGALVTRWMDVQGEGSYVSRPSDLQKDELAKTLQCLQQQIVLVGNSIRRVVKECGADPNVKDAAGHDALNVLKCSLPHFSMVTSGGQKARFIQQATLEVYRTLFNAINPSKAEKGKMLGGYLSGFGYATNEAQLTRFDQECQRQTLDSIARNQEKFAKLQEEHFGSPKPTDPVKEQPALPDVPKPSVAPITMTSGRGWF